MKNLHPAEPTTGKAVGLPALGKAGQSFKAEGMYSPSAKGLSRRTEREETSSNWLAAQILVVDDDELIRQQLERLFIQAGYRVTVCDSAEKALEVLEKEDTDLVLTDIRLPGLSGVQLAEQIVERWGEIPVIVITGFAEIETAVEVLKLGASDFIVKPFSAAAIQESVRLVLEKARVFIEIRHLRQYLEDKSEFCGILSTTPEMHRVFEMIRMVSETDSTVVIEGETGTGKELVASAIHHQSLRRKGPLITINCAGVPETLLESELFGYERGAFTGAEQARPGKIELAHGGTLFLDEIESMALSMQAKLLLVLNDQKVQRLGSSRWKQIDMRVIAASNIPLKELLARGRMRGDFYYRINVVPIRLIPLRQRLEDIPLLVQDFFRHHRLAVQKKITRISKEAMDRLIKYHWPGNIRELQNVLEKAIVIARSRVIEDVDLEEEGQPSAQTQKEVAINLPLIEWMKEQEKEYLTRQLEVLGGRIDLTAQSCGVDVRTIHRKMRLYGLDKRVFHRGVSSRSLQLVKTPSRTVRGEH
jgi:DNA-binding NtrC family response regulator